MSDSAAFALLCALYLPCEAVYLTMAGPQYSAMYAKIQSMGPKPLRYATFPYAPLAYLSYVPAWYILCLRDSVLGVVPPIVGVWKSFLFSVAVYGCFNFTNKVTFASWPVPMLVQDFTWGVTCLTVVGAIVVYTFSRKTEAGRA